MTLDFKKHFWFALALGLLLRIISAYFVFGPQALDDYLNQLEPALKLSAGLPLDIPAYRSPLMIWMITAWHKLAGVFSLDSVVSQIRWIYFFMGLASLLSLWAAYLYFKDEPDQKPGLFALYLISAHGLMPFISTRTFLESFSAGFLTLGVCLLALRQRSQSKSSFLWWGFVLVGLGTLIRFQAGLIYVFAVVFFLWRKQRKEVLAGILVGFGLLAIQSLIDLSMGREALSTLLNYLRANENVASYGYSPWYSSWGAWLVACFLFPFSLGLFKNYKALRPHLFLLGASLAFLAGHSLVDHFEERFLYPIFPISLILLAALWSASWGGWSEKFVFRPVFLAINALLLVVGCFVNTQVGEIGVPALIQAQSSNALFVDRDSLVGQGDMRSIFIKPPSTLLKVTEALQSDIWPQEALKYSSFENITFMTSNPQLVPELESFSGKTLGPFQCKDLGEMTSWADNLIYKMNPKRNYRRRPTWYVACWNSQKIPRSAREVSLAR